MVRWSFPTEVVFGAGVVREAGAWLAARACKRVLIVTDPGVQKAGLVAPLGAALEKAGVAFEVFAGVHGNPREADVEDGARQRSEFGAGALLALGGGSAMDVAKLIALRAEHHRPLADYDDALGGDALIGGQVLPIVAVPTTAGTGSEVGRSAVIGISATGRKTVIFSPKLLPSLALLDPELTTSMPSFISAATGYDALTHCVEAFVAQGDHPMCDGIALRGVELAARALPRVMADPGDLSARGAMMKAALMGAVAFQKGLGACHAMAHPLSSVCGLHHGLANALCLPAVVSFNGHLPEVASRYVEVARRLGAEPTLEGCVHALSALRTSLGLPASLREAGVTVDEPLLDKLADEAFADGCHQLNPRPCERGDLRALYSLCATAPG